MDKGRHGTSCTFVDEETFSSSEHTLNQLCADAKKDAMQDPATGMLDCPVPPPETVTMSVATKAKRMITMKTNEDSCPNPH